MNTQRKACQRGKRQLLILVLSEIRRLTFYQCVMGNQMPKLLKEKQEKRINSTKLQVNEHTTLYIQLYPVECILKW